MITNFFRIKPPAESFPIQRVPYSDQSLSRYRKNHNKDASFFRFGEHIYISPREDCELKLGDRVNINCQESPEIVLSLIRHMIFRAFRDAFPDRVPESFAPLRFFSARPEHDSVRKLLPDSLKGQIAFPRMIEVHVRRVLENNRPVFGILIGSRQRWQFNVALRKLRNEGFDLIGKTVLETHPVPGLEGILAPDESLLGEIASIRGDHVEILTNEGIYTRSLDNVQLQRTRAQIGSYLSFALGQDRASRIFQELRVEQRDRSRPSQHFAEASRFANWFSENKGQPRTYKNGDGFSFVATSNNVLTESVQIYPSKLIFDYGPGASDRTPFGGLSKFGPFNAARFERNDLRMLVLSHQQSRGAVTQFVKLLIDGMPESKYFQRGLKAFYRLSTVQPSIREVTSYLPTAFEGAIDTAIQEADGRGFDIALIECPEGSRQTPAAENPYYRARAKLMSYGIPTQGVRDQHLRQPKEALQWTLGPFALQIYAKVGGTPWRLPGNQSVDREMIVGIGNALERPNLWSGATQSRIVGITTFFLGDGSYVLGERLRSVPYADYFQELLKSLKTSISALAQEYAWKEGDSVRIVFHIFKPVRNIEADVVGKLIEQFPQYKILFAFVTVSTEHPWMMFREASERNGQIAATLCERGDNLILDDHSCLLQIRGDRDRPNKSQRPPYPVSIRVHEKSTYKDLKYIVQQIHDFSFLSWRSFFPSETPVTLFYSDLIASEAAKLQKIQGWDATFLDRHFRRKQWFL